MKTTFVQFEVINTWHNCHDRFNMRKVEITEIDQTTSPFLGDQML